MADSRLSQFAQVAEIMAAVAVVISLVYVGMEVQSNTAAIRGASMQAIATSDADTLMTVASDPSLSEVVRLGREDAEQLQPDQRFRYHLFMRNFWLSFQNIYQQRQLELLDEAVWQSYRTVICGMMVQRGPRQTWPEHADILDEKFVQVVEACKGTAL